MESTPDQKFVDNFSAVLAALVLFTFLIIVLAIAIANRTAVASLKSDDDYQARIDASILPLGDVIVSDRDETFYGRDPEESLAEARGEVEEIEIVMATFTTGVEVYDSACTACHGLGVAGAPKVGDSAQWSARLTQGMETIYSHAIEGYTGAAGIMPAMGNRKDLSQEQVKMAVDFMLENSR